MIVASNFATEATSFALKLPADLLQHWQLGKGDYELKDLLSERKAALTVTKDAASIQIELAPLDSVVLKLWWLNLFVSIQDKKRLQRFLSSMPLNTENSGSKGSGQAKIIHMAW